MQKISPDDYLFNFGYVACENEAGESVGIDDDDCVQVIVDPFRINANTTDDDLYFFAKAYRNCADIQAIDYRVVGSFDAVMRRIRKICRENTKRKK